MKGGTVVRWLAIAAVLGLLPAMASADLLLYLDARDPGPNPATDWQDLAGKNQPFTAGSYGGAGLPAYNGTAEVYEFGRSAALHWFECDPADESRFDFPAARWGDPNNPAGAVTIVAYIDNTGYTANNSFWNKGIGAGQHQWLSVNYEGQDVAYMDVGFNNQPGDRAMATSSGAGSTSGLQLWVFHFDGSGLGSNYGIYVNGSAANIAIGLSGNNALSNGTYDGSADPLHIGSPLGVTNPEGGRFFGDIQFIEVWGGYRCYQGMKPDEYSLWRGQNLDFMDLALPETCQAVIDAGYGMASDANSDCYVNLLDLAVMAGDWLRCVHPDDIDCDKPWL